MVVTLDHIVLYIKNLSNRPFSNFAQLFSEKHPLISGILSPLGQLSFSRSYGFAISKERCLIAHSLIHICFCISHADLKGSRPLQLHALNILTKGTPPVDSF